MYYFKRFADFCIDSSILVAFAAFAFLHLTVIRLNISISSELQFFVFFGTQASYTFIKYFSFFSRGIEKWNSFKGFLFAFSFFSFCIAGYCFFDLNGSMRIIAVFSLLVILLYTFPFSIGYNSGREWVGLKVFLVVLSWTLVTYVLPVFTLEQEFSLEIFFLGCQRFFLIYGLMCIFEIVDLQFDNQLLQTLPQRIGVKWTKLFSFFWLSLFLIIEIYFYSNQFSWINLSFLFIILLFLFFVKENSSRYFSDFWLESVPILWWLVLVCVC
jgi:hypothetical protein